MSDEGDVGGPFKQSQFKSPDQTGLRPVSVTRKRLRVVAQWGKKKQKKTASLSVQSAIMALKWYRDGVNFNYGMSCLSVRCFFVCFFLNESLPTGTTRSKETGPNDDDRTTPFVCSSTRSPFTANSYSLLQQTGLILAKRAQPHSVCTIGIFPLRKKRKSSMIFICAFLAARAARYVWAWIGRNEPCAASCSLPVGLCKRFSSCRPDNRSCRFVNLSQRFCVWGRFAWKWLWFTSE